MCVEWALLPCSFVIVKMPLFTLKISLGQLLKRSQPSISKSVESALLVCYFWYTVSVICKHWLCGCIPLQGVCPGGSRGHCPFGRGVQLWHVGDQCPQWVPGAVPRPAAVGHHHLQQHPLHEEGSAERTLQGECSFHTAWELLPLALLPELRVQSGSWKWHYQQFIMFTAQNHLGWALSLVELLLFMRIAPEKMQCSLMQLLGWRNGLST